MLHYYIYFRIPAERADAIDSAIQRMQQTIQAQLGITGRLLKKRDEPNLWMEIYENLPEDSGFEAVLTLAEEQSGIAVLLGPEGQRHIECFKN